MISACESTITDNYQRFRNTTTNDTSIDSNDIYYTGITYNTTIYYEEYTATATSEECAVEQEYDIIKIVILWLLWMSVGYCMTIQSFIIYLLYYQIWRRAPCKKEIAQWTWF